jgi:hypothetical protein
MGGNEPSLFVIAENCDGHSPLGGVAILW